MYKLYVSLVSNFCSTLQTRRWVNSPDWLPCVLRPWAFCHVGFHSRFFWLPVSSDGNGFFDCSASVALKSQHSAAFSSSQQQSETVKSTPRATTTYCHIWYHSRICFNFVAARLFCCCKVGQSFNNQTVEKHILTDLLHTCQHHDICSDPRGCTLQRGPAGGAAFAGSAAMHRTPSLLSHVSGQCWMENNLQLPARWNVWKFHLQQTKQTALQWGIGTILRHPVILQLYWWYGL